MYRHSLIVMAGLVMAVPATAAPWADSLFEETNRDFGAVPRGPMLTHPFRLTNTTNQDVRISSIRVSCGCVTATALTSELKPGQSTVVIAQMDTRRFVGHRQVTIYVDFIAPQMAETRLSVKAFTLDELTINPEAINYGQVRRGIGSTQKIEVAYRSDPNWQIVEAISQSNYVVPSVKRVKSAEGEVRYELTAKLRSDIPVGKWYTDIWLKTNQAGAANRLRVPVTVEVASALSLSPQSVHFRDAKAGSKSERKVLVRAAKPFKIVEIRGSDEQLTGRFENSEAKTVHVLTVTLQPREAGTLHRSLRIITDLPEDHIVDLATEATVKKNPAMTVSSPEIGGERIGLPTKRAVPKAKPTPPPPPPPPAPTVPDFFSN